MKNDYDVIVAGAGIAGIAAAVSAARAGARTLLVERCGVIGGMSTAELVSPFVRFRVQNGEKVVPLVGGVFEEINLRMEAEGGLTGNGFNAMVFRRVANDLLVDADVDLLLHATTVDVRRDGDVIKGIILQNDGRTEYIGGKAFIDTTDDEELLTLSAPPWVHGDEKKGMTRALMTFFRVGGVDVEKAVDDVRLHPDHYLGWSTKVFDPAGIVSIAGYADIVRRAKEAGELPDTVSYFRFTGIPALGEAFFHTTNVLGLNKLSSVGLSEAELEGRRRVIRVFTIVRRECPGFENSYIIETGVQTCVRETGSGVDDFAVTGSGVRGGARFDDAIARAHYVADIHGQEGEQLAMDYLKEGEYYEIPLRALLVEDCENLLMAGRSLSSTWQGDSALGIQATSAATGEAAGVAAALAARISGKVRSVSPDAVREILRTAGNI